MNTALDSAPVPAAVPVADMAIPNTGTTLPSHTALRLRTILVPTDFSAPAAEAVRRAEQFAQHAGARLILLHVFDDTDYIVADSTGLGLMGPLADYRAQARSVAEKELEAMADAARDRGLQAEARFCVGHAARQITAIAGDCDADLIVLSTHGRTGWKRLVLGSVAESVVRYAPCAVYTHHAHPDTASDASSAEPTRGLAQAPLRLRRILVATDFSGAADRALPWAETLAKEAGAMLTLLHVFSASKLTPGGVDNTGFGLATPLVESIVRDVRNGVASQLDALCRAARTRGVHAETLLLEGEAAARVSEAAHSMQSDLIVLATHGHTGWDRPLLGSTAERVVRHAHAPVLVVRGTRA